MGILVNEDIFKKVVEVQRKRNRVISIALVFGDKLLRVVCGYAPQSGRSDSEKGYFYEEIGEELDKTTNKFVVGLGDFNSHVGKRVEGFESVHGGNGIVNRNAEGRRLLEFCDKNKPLKVFKRKRQAKRRVWKLEEKETRLKFKGSSVN